jgi:hypothetical protein
MDKLKDLWSRLLLTLPTIWGMLWIWIITLSSVALLIQSFKWLLMALGVI